MKAKSKRFLGIMILTGIVTLTMSCDNGSTDTTDVSLLEGTWKLTLGSNDQYYEFSGTTFTWSSYYSGSWYVGQRGTFTDNGSSFTYTVTEQSTDGVTWSTVTPYTDTYDYVISGTILSTSVDNWANQADWIKQ